MSRHSHPDDERSASLSAPKFSSYKGKKDKDEEASKSKEKSGPVAPKFGSFKSKQSLPTREAAQGQRERDEEHHRARPKDERKRKRQRSPSRDRRGHHEVFDRKKERKSYTSARVELVNNLYMTDVKGDPLITRFGGINKSEIPAYYRGGRGRVLGTSSRLIIHRDTARDQFSLVKPGEGHWTSKDGSGLWSRIDWTKRSSFRVRADAKRSGEAETDDFISISLGKGEKNGRLHASASSSEDDNEPNYRSIEGKAKANQNVDDDDDDSATESESALRLDNEEDSNPLKWKSIQLNRIVKEDPNDISAWMELVDHQDALLQAGQTIDEKSYSNAVRSFTEIKVDMLESALSHATKLRERARILPRLMREGGKVWSTKKCLQKWEDLQEDEQECFDLWKEHLDYSMSSILDFSYDKIRAMLAHRLQQKVDFAETQASQDKRETFAEAIYIFMRATRFIHDAGYKELAVAAWQAMIEINFFRPSHKHDFDHFQEYWDSEVARIGEDGDKGFVYFTEKKDEDHSPPDPLPASNDQAAPSRDSFKAWGNLEELRSKQAEVPARTMDEGNDDDPFRVILFHDIRPYLFIIPETILSQVRSQLIAGFLLFCGLPAMVEAGHWTELAAKDPFMRMVVPANIDPKRPVEMLSTITELDESKAKLATDTILLEAKSTHELLFSGKGWFHSYGSAIMNEERIIKIFGRLTKDANILDLALPSLAIGLSYNPSGMKKLGKTLLKLFPTNIGLYTAYACCEASTGNYEIALKVLKSATGLLSGTMIAEKLQLLSERCRLELEWGHLPVAMETLLSVLDNAETELNVNLGIRAKGAREYFSRYYSEYIRDANRLASLFAAQCLVLMDYHTSQGSSEPRSLSQGDIAAAMAVVKSISVDYQGKGWHSVHVSFLQWCAKLLYTHASNGPFRRVYAQDNISYFLTFEPQNSVFLGLCEWFDSSLRVVDETRSLLQERVLVPPVDCISSRAFAIKHELSHGSVHSARNAFEQSLSSDACRSSTGIWIWYLRFCLSEKELRSKAKDVFYRAVKHCPWSKAVMMEAFVTLNREMDSSELRSVYETMESKGIRIHVDREAYRETQRREASHAGLQE